MRTRTRTYVRTHGSEGRGPKGTVHMAGICPTLDPVRSVNVLEKRGVVARWLTGTPLWSVSYLR